MRLSLCPLLAFAAFAASAASRAQTTPPAAPLPLPPAPLAPTVPPPGGYLAIAAKIDSALNAPALRHASVGVFVQSLTTGAVVYAHSAETSLTPASCEKLLTGSTALTQLGPDFVYHTTLTRTGTIAADGVLTGDLYLHGSGDPSLTSDDLTNLAKALAAQGVKHLRGHIYADASRFDTLGLGLGWDWEDEPYDYSAQVSALNCDENVVTVQVTPGAVVGQAPSVTLDGAPVTADLLDANGRTYLSIDETAQTQSGANTAIRIGRDRGINRFEITGTIPPGAKAVTDTLTVEDPALFAASRLLAALTASGIDSVAPAGPSGAVTGVIGEAATPTGTIAVGEKVSQPLSVLLNHCWKASDNLYAEAFLKTIGAEKGRAGSSRAGAAVVDQFLRTAGVDDGGIEQVDGCGLSRRDVVTAHALGQLLTYMDKQTGPLHDTFLTSLPIAGVDGTLRTRMIGTSAQGHVLAKTGTLSHVTALSGFATAQKSGERFVFSVLVNNFPDRGGAAAARALQDTVCATLCDQ